MRKKVLSNNKAPNFQLNSWFSNPFQNFDFFFKKYLSIRKDPAYLCRRKTQDTSLEQ